MKYPVCQSCGMPLYAPELHGTDADGGRVGEYCIHCYRDGGFMQDVTMEEMMRLCASYTEGNIRFRIAGMRTLYPHLKRWAKKEDTENEHYRSIRRVLEHVKANLHEPTDLKTLAGIARISPWHFHRIFKQVIGESLSDYVVRLRMEYVAKQLQTSAMSLAELAEHTGYSSEQALSRAFKNYFDLPPKTFRKLYFQETFKEELVPRICKIAAKTAIALREGGGWQRLYMYALVNRLLSEATESIEVIREGAFLPALTTVEQRPPDRHTESLLLPEGLYAIFTHRGGTEAVGPLYEAVCHYWLPKSKYRPGPGMPYVVFLSHPAQVPAAELLTEIYVPIMVSGKRLTVSG